MVSNFDDLLKTLPIADLAKQFGVDESTMTEAVSRAVPGLVGGMAKNASTEDGALSLVNATKKHTQASASLAEVDVEDGKKIVKKVLGDQENEVALALAGTANDSGVAGLIPKLLPMLAPLVMQFLAGQLGSGNDTKKAESSGGIGDILGGLLGGGSSGGGDLLGGVLGGLFGGGSGSSSGAKSSSGGGIGDLIGGLFGKK